VIPGFSVSEFKIHASDFFLAGGGGVPVKPKKRRANHIVKISPACDVVDLMK